MEPIEIKTPSNIAKPFDGASKLPLLLKSGGMGKRKKIIIYVVVFIILVLAATAIYFFYFKSILNNQKAETIKCPDNLSFSYSLLPVWDPSSITDAEATSEIEKINQQLKQEKPKDENGRDIDLNLLKQQLIQLYSINKQFDNARSLARELIQNSYNAKYNFTLVADTYVAEGDFYPTLYNYQKAIYTDDYTGSVAVVAPYIKYAYVLNYKRNDQQKAIEALKEGLALTKSDVVQDFVNYIQGGGSDSCLQSIITSMNNK